MFNLFFSCLTTYMAHLHLARKLRTIDYHPPPHRAPQHVQGTFPDALDRCASSKKQQTATCKRQEIIELMRHLRMCESCACASMCKWCLLSLRLELIGAGER